MPVGLCVGPQVPQISPDSFLQDELKLTNHEGSINKLGQAKLASFSRG